MQGDDSEDVDSATVCTVDHVAYIGERGQLTRKEKSYSGRNFEHNFDSKVQLSRFMFRFIV